MDDNIFQHLSCCALRYFFTKLVIKMRNDVTKNFKRTLESTIIDAVNSVWESKK